MKTASRVPGSAFFHEGFEVQDAPRYGVLHAELAPALYGLPGAPMLTNVIGGLGGREIATDELLEMVDVTKAAGHRARTTHTEAPSGVRRHGHRGRATRPRAEVSEGEKPQRDEPALREWQARVDAYWASATEPGG